MSTKTLGRWAVRLTLGIAVAIGAAVGSAALNGTGHARSVAEIGWQMVPSQWASMDAAQ